MRRVTYYFDNRVEIQADMKRDQEVADSLRHLFP